MNILKIFILGSFSGISCTLLVYYIEKSYFAKFNNSLNLLIKSNFPQFK